jgi:hypothetical protein
MEGQDGLRLGELWDIVEAIVPAIPVTAPVLVEEYRKRNNKAKMNISDAVRNHIICQE